MSVNSGKGHAQGVSADCKLIRPEIAFDQATIDRFRQELMTARGISHKNICRMYDLGRHGCTCFPTMEYVAGEDLKSMITMSGQLGIGTAISIAKRVCDRLAEAHRLGVVHRDLKPQNIQIDKGGHACRCKYGEKHLQEGWDRRGFTPCWISCRRSTVISLKRALSLVFRVTTLAFFF